MQYNVNVFKFFVIVYRLCFALLVVGAAGWQLAERALGPDFKPVDFLSDFAVLANLFIAFLFLASVWVGKRGHVFALLRGAAVVYMVAAGIGHAVSAVPEGAQAAVTAPWVDMVLHKVMPVVAVADWLLVPPRVRIWMEQLRRWVVFPIMFIAYSLIRGHLTGWYPYSFLDPSASGGYFGVAAYCLATVAAVVALSAAVVYTGNVMRRYAHNHPRHYPHYQDSNTPAVAWSGTKKHWLVLILASSIIGMIGVGGWTGWQFVQNARIETHQHIADTETEGIRAKTDTYKGRYFDGKAEYILTENEDITLDARHVANAYFMPCRNEGVQRRHDPVYTCDIEFTVNEASNDKYLVLTFTFTGSYTPERQRGLVYDRQNGERLAIGDIFKKDARFAEKVSSTARELLDEQFKDAYKAQPALKQSMEHATKPEPDAFSNFILTKDEKIMLYYDAGAVAPEDKGVVQLQLPPEHLYDVLQPDIVKTFMPKLEAKKEEERRLAAAARQRAEAAEIARQHARSLVAPNRSNIDCAQMKCIALTYDDGPGAYTAQLLDMLRARNAVATFYVLGSRAAANAGLLKRAVAEHNEVANHSWSHANLTHLSDASIASEVERTNHAIFNAIGSYPKSMRPPYGAYNNRVIAHIGMPVAMWSTDTLDWRDRSPGIVYQRAISGARPGGIILMHDIHATTVQATPRIIDELQRQGYVLVTVSELFGITGDNVQSFSGRVLRAR
jgi:peptidoglycan/xylan/chitin deacetylase (PgdA/CDA1 family)